MEALSHTSVLALPVPEFFFVLRSGPLDVFLPAVRGTEAVVSICVSLMLRQVAL